jgi:hypothetical protein
MKCDSESEKDQSSGAVTADADVVFGKLHSGPVPDGFETDILAAWNPCSFNP